MIRAFCLLFFILSPFLWGKNNPKQKKIEIAIINSSSNITISSIQIFPSNSYDFRRMHYLTPAMEMTLPQLMKPKAVIPYKFRALKPAMWKADKAYDVYIFDTNKKTYYLKVTGTGSSREEFLFVLFSGEEIYLTIGNQLNFTWDKYDIAPRNALVSLSKGYSVERFTGYFTLAGTIHQSKKKGNIWLKLADHPNWLSFINPDGTLDLDIIFYDKNGNAYLTPYYNAHFDKPNIPKVASRN